jgi:hypothetical protein
METVLLRSIDIFGNTSWRHVVLLMDISAENNMIASRVIKEHPQQSSYINDEYGISSLRALGTTFAVEGLVRIQWSSEPLPRQIHTMDCYIVDDDYAPFDIISNKEFVHTHKRPAKRTRQRRRLGP